MAKVITAIEAVQMMTDYTGHSFVHVNTKTEPKFIGYKKNKTVIPAFQAATGCDHPEDVRKYAEYNAQLGLSYPKLIERRLAKEGKSLSEYEAGETWHEATDTGCPNLRQHKTTKEMYFYLFLTANGHPKSRYMDMKKGVEIDRKAIDAFLQKSSAPTNQGLEEGNEVQVQTLKLSSLISIKLSGEEYIIA
jgi:hypothetical protein